MPVRCVNFALFVVVFLSVPTTRAADKSAPMPDGVKARLEWIADQAAAHEVLRGVFGKDLKASALDWLARSDYAVKYQFALCIRMATHFPALPKDENHAKLVESTIGLAKSRSKLQARIIDQLVKDEATLVAVLKNRAADLSDKKLAKNLTVMEDRYAKTITATDAVDLAQFAGQAPKELLSARRQLRDALLKTLRKKADLEKLFPERADASAELRKSRKRVKDLVRESEKKKD